MRLKEALPKPGQAPLGGASADDADITVPGLGVYKYGSLKKNLVAKLQDMVQRAEKEDFETLGKNEMAVISSMWLALANHKRG